MKFLCVFLNSRMFSMVCMNFKKSLRTFILLILEFLIISSVLKYYEIFTHFIMHDWICEHFSGNNHIFVWNFGLWFAISDHELRGLNMYFHKISSQPSDWKFHQKVQLLSEEESKGSILSSSPSSFHQTPGSLMLSMGTILTQEISPIV